MSDAQKVMVDLVLAMPHTEHALWARHPRVKVQEPPLPRHWASRVPAGRFFSRMPPAIEPGSMVVLPARARWLLDFHARISGPECVLSVRHRKN